MSAERTERFRTENRTLDIDGRVHEYRLLGERAGPLVVLISGLRAPLDSWEAVFNPLSCSHAVIACNRPGVGRSAKPTVAQSGGRIVADGLRLLEELALEPPYVLVGHSIGGLYANLAARTVPASIAGVVLVESAFPHEDRLYEGLPRPLLLRTFGGAIALIEKLRGNAGRFAEANFVEQTSTEVERAPPFPPVPLAVVSGERSMPMVPAEATRIHRACQTRLLALSPIARRFSASTSGHAPQITEPDVVIEAIEWVLNASRATAPARGPADRSVAATETDRAPPSPSA